MNNKRLHLPISTTIKATKNPIFIIHKKSNDTSFNKYNDCVKIIDSLNLESKTRNNVVSTQTINRNESSFSKLPMKIKQSTITDTSEISLINMCKSHSNGLYKYKNNRKYNANSFDDVDHSNKNLGKLLLEILNSHKPMKIYETMNLTQYKRFERENYSLLGPSNVNNRKEDTKKFLYGYNKIKVRKKAEGLIRKYSSQLALNEPKRRSKSIINTTNGTKFLIKIKKKCLPVKDNNEASNTKKLIDFKKNIKRKTMIDKSDCLYKLEIRLPKISISQN